MSGSGTTSLASRMTQIPIWNFHAANDGTVNVSGSRTMIGAVRSAGGNAIYTEYASGGHVIWTPAYNTPILMNWVYAQRRGTNSTARPLLSINVPTDLPIYASSATNLALSGTASDGGSGPSSVTWTNYQGAGTSILRGGRCRNHRLGDYERRPEEHCHQPNPRYRNRNQLVSELWGKHHFQ